MFLTETLAMVRGTETTIQLQSGSILFSGKRQGNDFHSDERGAGWILTRESVEFRAALFSGIGITDHVVTSLYKAECDFLAKSRTVGSACNPTDLFGLFINCR